MIATGFDDDGFDSELERFFRSNLDGKQDPSTLNSEQNSLNEFHSLWYTMIKLLVLKELQKRRRFPLASEGFERPGESLTDLIAMVQRELFNSLGDPELKRILELKMACYPNDLIAAERKRSLASVERKLKMIRTIWSKQLA